MNLAEKSSAAFFRSAGKGRRLPFVVSFVVNVVDLAIRVFDEGSD